jgi:leucyl/phenylalanyl-tRNA--protein transferase
MMKLFASELKTFPPPEQSGPEGLLQVSNNISVERLLEAYSFGIFPWPTEGYPILWFSPQERGVVDFKNVHTSRSLAKWMRQNDLRFTWDSRFATVIECCGRAPRSGQSGTWITPRLKRAYINFHEAGYAHSLECWRAGELIGGLYGVYVAGAFCGESMFFLESNASKACLVYLVEFLEAHGLTWFDTQMVTPTIEHMGGKTISQSEFLSRLERAKLVAKPISFK